MESSEDQQSMSPSSDINIKLELTEEEELFSDSHRLLSLHVERQNEEISCIHGSLRQLTQDFYFAQERSNSTRPKDGDGLDEDLESRDIDVKLKALINALRFHVGGEKDDPESEEDSGSISTCWSILAAPLKDHDNDWLMKCLDLYTEIMEACSKLSTKMAGASSSLQRAELVQTRMMIVRAQQRQALEVFEEQSRLLTLLSCEFLREVGRPDDSYYN